jgi:hypothetical protein
MGDGCVSSVLWTISTDALDNPQLAVGACVPFTLIWPGLTSGGGGTVLTPGGDSRLHATVPCAGATGLTATTTRQAILVTRLTRVKSILLTDRADGQG